MWYPGKRRKELIQKIDRLQDCIEIVWMRTFEARRDAKEALQLSKTVRTDFNSRFSEAIDRKYEFDEILMCMDDIMDHLNL